MVSGRASDPTEQTAGGAGTAVLDRPTAGDTVAPRGRRLALSRADLVIGAVYLVLATYVLSGQWRDTHNGYLVKSGQDQFMWEWFFAETAHAIAHLQNPLGTHLQNFPDGVNMMANTAMFGVGVPLIPVTMLFGPTVTFVLVLTLGLSGTAFAWYWLFSRELVRSRFAAVVGGLFCGFAPAMISHANAHPNFVLLAALPAIAALLIRMARRALAEESGTDTAPSPAGWWHRTRQQRRDTILLAALLTLQIALGEEPLLIFSLGFGVFAIVYYLHRPRAGLRVLRGLAPTVAAAALITLALTAIPLWWQFCGPQSYGSIDHGPMGNDVKTLAQFPSESLGGEFVPGQNVAINPTEQNAYFGWPLLILVAVAAILLWRRRDRSGEQRAGYRVVRAGTVVILGFGVLSLGSPAMFGTHTTGINLPWHWLANLPLLDTMLETRFSMAAVPAIAAILALATERALAYWQISLSEPRPLIWFAALALALVPLAPTILPVTHRPAVPSFFTHGTVERYVTDGSVVIAPPPTRLDASPLRWQYAANFDFPIAGGYFVGPMADKKGGYGPIDRPTAGLLMDVKRTGHIPRIDAATRERARKDLRYWNADIIVLPPTRNADALQDALNQLLNVPEQYVDGVRLWDVRGLS
ncbi:glycosyl transferase [Nocardia jiangxiensis]|uniref:Glycosyl transferase n=1 Tax=Nocardia jiangxiensis TaxID=282685 RepID=A0ABW6RXG4_9NOCA